MVGNVPVQFKTDVASVLAPWQTIALDDLKPVGTAPESLAPAPEAGLTESELLALRQQDSIPTRLHPETQPLATPAAGVPQTPGPTVVFDGNRRSTSGGVIRSDMALAVGDNNSTHPILQANNACISLFDRNGKPRYDRAKALNSLFNAPGVKIFDPRAMYDWEYKRYIIVATEKDDFAKIPGHYWIAVSATNDSAGKYYVYRLPMPSGGDNAFADFPRIGQDRNCVYLASNKFSIEPRSVFQYEEWLMLPKVWLYEGSGVQYRYFFDTKVLGLTTDSSQPANVCNPDDSPGYAYFISSKAIKVGGGLPCQVSDPCNGLFVWSIMSGQPSPYMPPVVAAALVPTGHNYVQPGYVTQKANFPLGNLDTRISGQVTYRAGSLYCSLNTRNNAGRSSVLMFEVVPTMSFDQVFSAKITDEALLEWGGNNNSTFLATSQPDGHGNTLTVFNVSGTDYNPSTAYVLRSRGQFSSPAVVVREGKVPFYNQDGWGDYSAVASDGPSTNNRPSAMWFAGSYVWGSDQEWGTVIGRVEFPSTADS